ncbi:hypothetical protein HYDPIDRAFT_34649 [Hydnomerulius pinastri MD-312]|uniref:Uncharacterized protein n=1 Tax=Hydnomerulius pinastri MD-312 TaxID=994086 RepID=A0A0C9VXA8_9AGAM|nr:hypothetical protein HYDPIDRAFT_34649 [Hydnomerulius pinastri MD-312]
MYEADLRKTDIFNRRLITSRKRTRNLFDIASTWKRTVLHTPVLADREVTRRSDGRIIDSDEDEIQIHRHSPPAPRAWTYGA